jgi:hypothetical protein
MATLRENLKEKIDEFNEEQLQLIASFIEHQLKHMKASIPIETKETPAERARAFREWASNLPRTSPVLPAEAISRDSIYE